MPQLDISTFPSQLFWLAIAFVTLYLLASRLILPRVSEVLAERQKRISDHLDRAAALKVEAEGVLAAYEAAMAQARADAQTMVRQVTESISTEAQARHHELAERLAGEIKAAEERINQAKVQALAGVRDVAIEAAQAATARLTGVELPAARVAAEIDAVMEEHA